MTRFTICGFVAVAAATAALVYAVVPTPAPARPAPAAVAPALPAAAAPSRFLDMRTPASSVRSYAASLRAHRYRDACEHETADDDADAEECLRRMARIGSAADALEVVIVGVARHGSRAEVRFASTMGFERGTARLSLVGGRWLIAGFRPDP